jgi:hypothetical protein
MWHSIQQRSTKRRLAAVFCRRRRYNVEKLAPTVMRIFESLQNVALTDKQKKINIFKFKKEPTKNEKRQVDPGPLNKKLFTSVI